MPKFSYTEIPNTQEPARPIFRPYLYVYLVYNGKTRGYSGLIDTGADISLAHSDIATILGIDDIKSGRLWRYGGAVDKQEGTAYIHEVHMIIPNHSSLDLDIAFTSEIASGLFLLGHRGFLEKYQVNLCFFKGYFEVINPKDKGYH